ncbi:TlpA disulfide reductase family protein [Pedobacter metabolipauper]|uniref:Thiol-disulfide isomerase/thioredoxin n=1 Tax=Pedobacter metabolipauper TaxID=425513 RepID=A0A4R6SRD2_9SPHI|nr:TlpA disulfide reductase family protein [Pedobacter metabolipauper]TDQ07492.1 thiol-disulfide isomerase/thioredoxin [Pedobacter metabolipauper]
MKFNIKNTIAILLCSSTSICMAQDKFTISGTLPQAGNEKMVLLTYVNALGKSAKDSALVKEGKFNISGTTAFGNRSYLELKPIIKDSSKKTRADFKEFYLEKGNTLVVGKDSMGTASISGTKVQSDNLEYHSKMDPWQAKYQNITARYFKAKAAKDSVELKQISVDAKPVVAKMESTLDDFIFSHPDSYVTADLVLGNRMMVIDVVKFDPIYKVLSQNVLSSFTGKKITDKYMKAKQFAIGKSIDFTLPDKDGKEFKLSSLKGKYVLVDFWASWCVPCRAENPFLLKAYTELKDKNFEIVGVSLDDKRASWLNAVAVDKMPWTQVSDVKGFKTEIAVRFGITAIPQNVLIDPDGKVIAKDLRGEDVNKKIAGFIK